MTSQLPQGFITQVISGRVADEPGIRKTLLEAGQTHLMKHAGFIPDACDAPLPEQCTSHTGQYCSDVLVMYAYLIYKQRFCLDLLKDFTVKLNKQALLIPPEFLPGLITAGDKKPYYQREKGRLRGLIGQRGHWLQQQMKPASTSDTGDEADHITPHRGFQQLRQGNPQAAQHVLQCFRGDYSAQTRHERLTEMLINLRVEDEDFLENMAAYPVENAEKLQRDLCPRLYDLPESRMRELIHQRIVTVLQYDRERDRLHLDEKQLTAPLGTAEAYTNWQIEVWDALRIVPPRFWRERWHISSQHLLALIQKHRLMFRYEHPWLEAAFRTHDTDFIEAVASCCADNFEEQHFQAMMTLLSVESRVHILTCWLTDYINATYQKPPNIRNLLFHFIGTPTNHTLSQLAIDALEKLSYCRKTKASGIPYEASRTLDTLSHYVTWEMSNAYLQAVDRLYSISMSGTKNYYMRQHRFFFTFRQQMHDAFKEQSW